MLLALCIYTCSTHNINEYVHVNRYMRACIHVHVGVQYVMDLYIHD